MQRMTRNVAPRLPANGAGGRGAPAIPATASFSLAQATARFLTSSLCQIALLARVVELVDTQVSEACAAMHGSSSLPSGTITRS